MTAARIHASALVFDAHVDTPQRLLFQHLDLGIRDPEGCIDIPRMRDGNIGAIFFALWVPIEITGTLATKRALDLLDAVLQEVQRHAAELMLARTSTDVRKARAENRIAILLGVEGGHAIQNSLGALRDFWERGVRYLTLTHNAATDWADSSNDKAKNHGLTDFGREVIFEMNRLGMLVDISHVSDKTFTDVIETSRAPVIASHSCCRALSASPRNLTDEMIKTLAARGGVIHIAFHNAFLSQEYLDARRARGREVDDSEKEIEHRFAGDEARILIELQKLSDNFIAAGKLPPVRWQRIVDHIDHAVALVGTDHVGLGSDFDGAYMPSGMEDSSQLAKITRELSQRGYAETDIHKILGENTLRVLGDVERIAQSYLSRKG